MVQIPTQVSLFTSRHSNYFYCTIAKNRRVWGFVSRVPKVPFFIGEHPIFEKILNTSNHYKQQKNSVQAPFLPESFQLIYIANKNPHQNLLAIPFLGLCKLTLIAHMCVPRASTDVANLDNIRRMVIPRVSRGSGAGQQSLQRGRFAGIIEA